MDERGDAVWDLLGHASHTEAGPYFARRVLREIRHPRDKALPGMPWLRWLIPAAAAASVALVLGMSLPRSSHEIPSPSQDLDEAFAIAAGFEDLVAVNSGWGLAEF